MIEEEDEDISDDDDEEEEEKDSNKKVKSKGSKVKAGTGGVDDDLEYKDENVDEENDDRIDTNIVSI